MRGLCAKTKLRILTRSYGVDRQLVTETSTNLATANIQFLNDTVFHDVLESIAETTSVPASIIIFATGLRLLAQIGVISSYKLHQRELDRKEAFLQHKLLRRNYTSEVRSEIARYFVGSTLFKAAFKDPEYQKSHNRQIAAAGRQCLQDHFFSPKNPERKQFDIDREGLARYQRLGEITMMKRTVPNLAPIPLFFFGSYTMRSSTTATVTDLSGMTWMSDSQFLWIDSLAAPDLALSICAGLATAYAFRLTSIGITRDFMKRRRYLEDSEVFFFSPTSPIHPRIHNNPELREYTRVNSFYKNELTPLPRNILQSFVMFALFPFVSCLNSFMPAVVPLYMTTYMSVRILSEYIVYTSIARRTLGFDPHVSLDTQKSPFFSLAKSSIGVDQKTTEISQFYLDKYNFSKVKIMQKFFIALKQPIYPIGWKKLEEQRRNTEKKLAEEELFAQLDK